jgi:hypothetical protein
VRWTSECAVFWLGIALTGIGAGPRVALREADAARWRTGIKILLAAYSMLDLIPSKRAWWYNRTETALCPRAFQPRCVSFRAACATAQRWARQPGVACKPDDTEFSYSRKMNEAQPSIRDADCMYTSCFEPASSAGPLSEQSATPLAGATSAVVSLFPCPRCE